MLTSCKIGTELILVYSVLYNTLSLKGKQCFYVLKEWKCSLLAINSGKFFQNIKIINMSSIGEHISASGIVK